MSEPGPPSPRSMTWNAALILIGRAAQTLSQVVVVTLLLQRLGLAQFATLGFLLALTGVSRQAGELGQDLGLARGHLRAAFPADVVVGAALVCRVAVVLLTTVPLWFVVGRIAPTEGPTFLFLQAEVLMLLVSGALFADYRAREEARPESLGYPLTGIAAAVLTWLFATSPASYACCSFASSCVQVAVAVCNPWTPVPRPALPPPWSAVRVVFLDSLAVAACSALSCLYARAGLLVLYVWAGAEATGPYSAGQRILQVAVLVPASLAFAIFPRLSRFLAAGSPLYDDLAQRSFDLGVTLGLPAAATFCFVVPDLLGLVLGERAVPIVPVAQVMAGSLGAAFVTTMLGIQMLAGRSLAGYALFWLAGVALHCVTAGIAVASGVTAVGAARVMLFCDLAITVALYGLVRKERSPLALARGPGRGALWGCGATALCVALAPAGPVVRSLAAGLFAAALAWSLRRDLEMTDDAGTTGEPREDE